MIVVSILHGIPSWHTGDLSIHKRLVEFWQGHNIQALANKIFKMIIPLSAECDVIANEVDSKTCCNRYVICMKS